MIIYHPAFDSYHCMIRLLKILKSLNKEEVENDRLLIYDYFLLFPRELRKVTLPISQGSIKNLLSENKYNLVSNSINTFKKLNSTQLLALNALKSYGIVSVNPESRGVSKTKQLNDLDFGFLNISHVEAKYLEFVNNYFETISLKELKTRTHLMTSRYEPS